VTGFEPTHRVVDGGADAWSAPDPSTQPVARLDGGLEVAVLGDPGKGYVNLECSNGWQAFTNRAWLIPLGPAAPPPPPPTAPPPPPPPPPPPIAPAVPTESDIPTEELDVALGSAAAVLRSFAAGEIDPASARRGLLDAGLVFTDTALWILDLEHGRWLRYDGRRLRPVDDPMAERVAP